MWGLANFCGVDIITYCLMGNHIHILMRTSPAEGLSDGEIWRRILKHYGRKETWVQSVDESMRRTGTMDRGMRKLMLARMGDVSQFMRELKQRFSNWYNKRNSRFGTLWAERFKSVLVEDSSEALRTVSMYIDLNPVRAGIVDDPKEYRFCGYAEAVAGLKAARRGILDYHGSGSWRKAHAEYRCTMMVYAGAANSEDKVALNRDRILEVLRRGGHLDPGEVLRLRVRYFSDGVVFGSRSFVDGVFEEFRDRFGSKRKTGARSMRGIGSTFGDLTTIRDLQLEPIT